LPAEQSGPWRDVAKQVTLRVWSRKQPLKYGVSETECPAHRLLDFFGDVMTVDHVIERLSAAALGVAA